jgi:hypothetical protein
VELLYETTPRRLQSDGKQSLIITLWHWLNAGLGGSPYVVVPFERASAPLFECKPEESNLPSQSKWDRDHPLSDAWALVKAL